MSMWGSNTVLYHQCCRWQKASYCYWVLDQIWDEINVGWLGGSEWALQGTGCRRSPRGTKEFVGFCYEYFTITWMQTVALGPRNYFCGCFGFFFPFLTESYSYPFLQLLFMGEGWEQSWGQSWDSMHQGTVLSLCSFGILAHESPGVGYMWGRHGNPGDLFPISTWEAHVLSSLQ